MALKYPVNEEFFSVWSQKMAYVLGFLFADGSLEEAKDKRGKYVRVSSIDKDRIVLFKELMSSEHTIVKYLQPNNRKMQYLLRIGNTSLFDSLIALGLTTRKSMSMRFPSVPLKYLASFILGYFDGDGCVTLERQKRTREVKRLLCVFTSGSKIFLRHLHLLLGREAGIKGNGLYKHGSSLGTFQLRYSTRDSLSLFLFMYKSPLLSTLALQRKYDIFNEYLALRGLEKRSIQKILTEKGPVAK